MSDDQPVDSPQHVNRKHVAMMAHALGRVYKGIFEELDIRTLLLGIREYALTKADEARDVSVRKALPYLADIAHCIAHPELRDEGHLRKYVGSVDKQKAKAHRKMWRQKEMGRDLVYKTLYIAVPPLIERLEIQHVLDAFVFALGKTLGNHVPFPINEVILEEQFHDIELCFFSILHMTEFLMHDDAPDSRKPGQVRSGYLAIHSIPGQGRYHLYSGIRNSKYEDTVSRGVKRAGRPFISSFPIFDGKNNSSAGGIQLDLREPKVVFAVRMTTGELALKETNIPWLMSRLQFPVTSP